MPRIAAKPQRDEEAADAAPVAVIDPPTPHPHPVAVLERRIETVTIAVPLGEIGPGHTPQHVQTWLKPHQAAALQELVVALRDKRATMGDRREIRTAADAIRWMLEQIAVKRGWTC